MFHRFRWDLLHLGNGTDRLGATVRATHGEAIAAWRDPGLRDIGGEANATPRC